MSEKLTNIYTNSALRETLGKSSWLWVIQAGTKYSTPLRPLPSIWKAGPPFSPPTSGHKRLFLELTNVMVIAGVSRFVGMLGLAHKFSIFLQTIPLNKLFRRWSLPDLDGFDDEAGNSILLLNNILEMAMCQAGRSFRKYLIRL